MPDVILGVQDTSLNKKVKTSDFLKFSILVRRWKANYSRHNKYVAYIVCMRVKSAMGNEVELAKRIREFLEE